MSNAKLFVGKTFHNCDNEVVEYDGSEVTWRVSAYVVVVKDDQVLIIKNKFEKLYDVIGGGIDLGETIEEAIHREAMEEAGATIKLVSILHAETDWFLHRQGSYHQTIQLFYRAELIGDLKNPTDSETEWVGFVPLSEIGNRYRFPETVEKVLKEKL